VGFLANFLQAESDPAFYWGGSLIDIRTASQDDWQGSLVKAIGQHAWPDWFRAGA
jgi:hypothetical protein